jgi:hypothetical protein
MAIVDDNPLTIGLRGKFGKMFVFRKMNGKTFASRAPGKQDKTKETAPQRKTRTNFRDAALWAKATLSNPEKKAYFQKRAKALALPNAYTAAVKEYLIMHSQRAKNAANNQVEMAVPLPQSQITVSQHKIALPLLEVKTERNSCPSIDLSTLGFFCDPPGVSRTLIHHTHDSNRTASLFRTASQASPLRSALPLVVTQSPGDR